MKPVCRVSRPEDMKAMNDVVLSANPHLEERINTFATRGARWHDATPVACEAAGEIVSCAVVFHREVWVGSAKKRFGGIGAVATRSEARGKGYATQVLAMCEEVMRERGYGVAILFCSIVEFYQRLGWSVVEEDWIEFALPRSRPPSSYRVEQVSLTEIPRTIRQLFDEAGHNAIVRPDDLWEEYGRWQREDADLFLSAYTGDQPVACVRGRRAREKAGIRLMEAAFLGGHDDALLRLLQQQRATIAGDAPVKVHAFLSQAHPLASALTRAGIETTWKRTSPEVGVMMCKPLAVPRADVFLRADDFAAGVPWSPRVWWAIDRF